jgi:predicted dehydrogenase
MEAFMYRFHPRIESLIDQVRAGALGPLHMIQSSFTFKLTRPDNIRLRADLGGGALMDVGSYCVNISRTLAGGEPEAVQAVATWTGTGVDDRLAGTLLFANGLIAQIDCALSMARRESIVAAGTNGYYFIPAAFLPGKEAVLLYEFRDRQEIPHQFSGCDEYQLMVEHFTECILNRKQPRYTAMDAAANMLVIEALYQSARNNGKWQTVHPLA